MANPICPYCGSESKQVKGRDIYLRARNSYADKTFYQCTPCDAYVGCHPSTDVPLGRLANAPLRKARNAAHAIFDLKWRSGNMKRKEAYAWLAEKLGLDRKDCHIALMEIEMCQRVVEVCNG